MILYKPHLFYFSGPSQDQVLKEAVVDIHNQDQVRGRDCGLSLEVGKGQNQKKEPT